MPIATMMNALLNAGITAANLTQQDKMFAKQIEMYEQQLAHEEHMADKANAFTKSENELAFEREKEMWNMQNFYNSPAEQMKRYADAGLNPNLIYGQGTSGNANNMPSYQPVTATKPNSVNRPNLESYYIPHQNIASGIDKTIQDYQRLGKDLEQKDEEINFTSANTALTDEKVISQRIQNDFDLRTQDLRYLSMDLDNKVKLGILSEKEAQTEYLKQKAEIDKKDYRLRESKVFSDIKYQNKKTEEVAHDINNKIQMLEKLKAETQKYQIDNKLNKETYEDRKKIIEFQLKKLIDEYNTQSIINAVKRLTGRENFGSDPLSTIHLLLARGEVAIEQIIDSL